MAEEHKILKILVVEDDVFMVDLLVHELKKAGFEIIVANTGREGVQKYQESKPDLVLLDIILPDLNGLDALREIRRGKDGDKAKVVILSNLGTDVDKEQAKRLGALDYLVKANFSLEEILERIRAVLSASK